MFDWLRLSLARLGLSFPYRSVQSAVIANSKIIYKGCVTSHTLVAVKWWKFFFHFGIFSFSVLYTCKKNRLLRVYISQIVISTNHKRALALKGFNYLLHQPLPPSTCVRKWHKPEHNFSQTQAYFHCFQWCSRGSYLIVRDAVKDFGDLRRIFDWHWYWMSVGHAVSGQCCL